MPVQHVTLTTELVTRAARHIRNAMKQAHGIDSAALCMLNGQCVWASDPAFEQAAPTIAKIGLMSVRLWAKIRSGKIDRIGLITDQGIVDILYVGPIASMLVVSGHDAETSWMENEPAGLLNALDLPQRV